MLGFVNDFTMNLFPNMQVAGKLKETMWKDSKREPIW